MIDAGSSISLNETMKSLDEVQSGSLDDYGQAKNCITEERSVTVSG